MITYEPQIKQIGNLLADANRSFKNPQIGRIYDSNGLCPTIITMQGGNREPKIVESVCLNSKAVIETNCIYPRIRKLTPRECFRLMGVSESDIDKIQAAGISNSQQYKMAGNSIVVDCLAAIFNKMFLDRKDDNQQLSLF